MRFLKELGGLFLFLAIGGNLAVLCAVIAHWGF